ncbi:Golgi CORVET complex core vacuolar protein 8-domain-containing protein [Mycena rebaudengoi]|nr:Golgi CORVET complex core vacuolar protein 8-domain-containing protein [Mycena rebaudengoi]
MSFPEPPQDLDEDTNTLRFEDGDDQEDEFNAGDYSSRMEDLMADDDANSDIDEEDEDDDGGFLYTGADAGETSAAYRDRLRDALGSEHDPEEELDASEVERSLILPPHTQVLEDDDEPLDQDGFSDHIPSVSVSSAGVLTPPRTDSPGMNGTPSKLLARPFLHPNVSRLRSFTPGSRPVSSASFGSLGSHFFDASPPPSHFSAISRMSSTSNLNTPSLSDAPNGRRASAIATREVFRWTQLRNITHHMYAPKAGKASSILGPPSLGAPTVLAANGLICVGTDDGKICVYDFKQSLKCVCGNDVAGKTVGPVSALALSHDHTFVASGHTSGHIQLFDLKTPHTPARSGVRRGHLRGSRIVNIGFVAGRHTALVTADENGLAFYHSLGKVLFVEASDILRILGKYPDDENVPSSPSAPSDSLAVPTTPLSSRRRRKNRYTVLAMMPLPLGTTLHPTDSYNIIALLTPTKLVVVGLKPTPKTWFKCPRKVDGVDALNSKSKWKGALAWFPSTSTGPITAANGASANGKPPAAAQSAPVLAYSWGNTLHLIRVSESRVKQLARNARTGKTSEIDVGRIEHTAAGSWAAEDDILAVQWLNANQVVVLTATTLNVYDARVSKLVERVQFDGLALISPTLGSTVNGAVPYADSVGDVAHSIRVYKGKIFLLTVTFSSAIDLTRSYYVGDAPGNSNGLPDDPELRREVVGQKMRDLMDETHTTADGRGVDRTSLFEGLVTSCARACIALKDFDFLFEDLFQQYEDAGISRIFLLQLEAFVLSSEIRHVPPRITQRLVALHDGDGRPDLVERIIWHIDPTCLDINQAIHLCQAHHLYDALIYVYTRALRDYVAPVVELLGLIRRVQHNSQDNSSMESVILDAYKIYPYLANVLSGLSYPSEEPLPEEEASQAKKDVYTVLSFLHSLDIAFEDAYLNDESQGVSRLVVVRILLEILASGHLPVLHGILDVDTREDRQLAAEYLLSVYNPHESDRIVHLFESAGFYRILRSWYRQEQQWVPLLSTYFDDTELRSSEVFSSVDEILENSTRSNKGTLPPDIIATLAAALPQLLDASIPSTAALLDRHTPDLHEIALNSLGETGDHDRFVYLRHLLGPPVQLGGPGPSLKPPQQLRQRYVSLQCRYHPREFFPPELLDWPDVIEACESSQVYDAVVWALNWRGDPREALSKAETFEKLLTRSVVEVFSDTQLDPQAAAGLRNDTDRLQAVGRTGIDICLERSQDASATEVPLEDIWFQLLSSQINCVQNISASQSHSETLSVLRSLVQDTFGALVSISSTRAVSFPRLFKRLVTSATHASTGTQYTEFRTILTGMLESYRSDGDMLAISKNLVDRDLFETVAEATRERARGWAPHSPTCAVCRKSLFTGSETLESDLVAQVIVARTGMIYHALCLPPES